MVLPGGRRAGRGLRVPDRGGRWRPRPRSAVRRGCPRACSAPPASSTTTRSTGPTPVGRPARWPRRSSTSSTWGRSPTPGRSEVPSAHLDHLVELGVTHVELMPVAAFAGAPRLGLRRCRLVRTAPGLRRPRRPEGPDRCLPRHGSGRAPRRRLQPPRAGGEPPRRSSGPTSPTPYPRRGARPSTSTVPTATRSAASSSTTP